jgi:hypothetical protein
MSVETLFKSHVNSLKYVFKDGTVANFIAGKYYTSVKKHVEELKAEVAGNPTWEIYIDSKESTIDTAAVDPLSRLRAELEVKIRKEMAAQINPQNDFGKVEQGIFSPASTTDIAAVSAGGDGAQLAQRLSSLVGKSIK